MQTTSTCIAQTGVRFSWGLVSGGTDFKKLIETAKVLADADALLAFEGNNEPNNWGVTYQGEEGGGSAPSWMAVAKLQRDLYRAVKSDPVLKKYPGLVDQRRGCSEGQRGTAVPHDPARCRNAHAGRHPIRRFRQCAQLHLPSQLGGRRRTTKPGMPPIPSAGCKIDGLYGNYGVTWAQHFRGYSEEPNLRTLPRVTTETGTHDRRGDHRRDPRIESAEACTSTSSSGAGATRPCICSATEPMKGAIRRFGFFDPDYQPRKAAVYLHNLTTILADKSSCAEPAALSYSIPVQPATVHDLLLQNSDGQFQLIVWGERVEGADDIVVELERPADVTVYDPTKGTEPIEKQSQAKIIRLRVSDHPLVLSLGM